MTRRSVPLRPLVSRSARLSGRLIRNVARAARLRAVAGPFDSGGFLGASVATWVATSPSLLPRTWWMTATNIGMSQTYGYALGWTAERVVKAAGRVLGVQVSITPDHRDRARLLGSAVLLGITAYSWVSGNLRQREISRLVRQEPKGLSTHAMGTLSGSAGALGVLITVRAIRATARIYARVLQAVLPRGIVPVASVLLTAATVLGTAALLRSRLLESLIERAEAANALFSPDVRRPSQPERSGSPASRESWESLGAAGRRVVSGGAPTALIEQTVGRALGHPVMEPIRAYASKGSKRTLEQAVEAVLAELDRTRAWERSVVVLFTGTGTGWLQEWSLSAVEFLTGGDCATASLQYSLYPSGLSYITARNAPQQAGRMLFQRVRERLDAMPEETRPRLFVAGESLGSFGGHAAFRNASHMLASVDGAVWTGTPRSTPIHRELTAARRDGSPQIAPVIEHGRHVRFVTRESDLGETFYGGLLAPWEAPRVVYAQHASDPVVWWEPRLLWEEPTWMRERVGRDVTSAIRWFPWISFWQIAADMPLSITTPGGHGHSYHGEMVPIWAAVLQADPTIDLGAVRRAIGSVVSVGGSLAPEDDAAEHAAQA